MKKILAILLVISLLIIPIKSTVYAETTLPSRTINLVYDDSGSMIRTDGAYVDTWCQAKYAMEVFAAMLGEKDVLNIYYMSDYVHGTTAPPKLSLHGGKDSGTAEANVRQIHELITDASDTPFDSVEKAYEDLKTAGTDEQWLVVLTDGEFNDASNAQVENYFQGCASDGKTSIMMLSMGPKGAVINADPERRIYFEKAESTADILSKLTGICNRIFQRNALTTDKSSGEISFQVPMGQLIVFAQGKNVSIGNITDEAGTVYTASSNVAVAYSNQATTDTRYSPDQVVVADNLLGYVATFDAEFEPGAYKLDISGAEDLQVYYKPNVTIEAYLFDGDNEEVTGEENLVSGEYRLEFGFVNASTKERVTDTSLLGNINYSSVIRNQTSDGVETLTAESGDIITIKEGTLNIDVTAAFLEYNTVNAKLSYQVYNRSDLIFTIEDKPVYKLAKDGFENGDAPIVLMVMSSNRNEVVPLTQEQWELLGTPEVTTTAGLGEFQVVRTEEIGKYLIYPTLKGGDPMKTATGTVPIKVSGGFTQGLSSYKGELNDTFEIENGISFMERATEWLKKNWLKLTVSILLFLLLLGYIPPFKKYLPRKLKKRPLIECSAERVGVRDTESHGKYKRKLVTTLIPYKAEKGFVVFSPSPHKKTAQLRAAGGNGMYVTNIKAFAGKEEISFNGMSMEADRHKPYRISAGSTISLRTTEYTYTCYLNR